MNVIPQCPYCGAEMTGELNEFFSNTFEYRYICERCGSAAPYALVEKELEKGLDAAKAKALELALHRINPRNRVLTLEEMAGSDDFVWAETIDKIFITYDVYVTIGIENAMLEKGGEEPCFFSAKRVREDVALLGDEADR